jgi:hypothetical protein
LRRSETAETSNDTSETSNANVIPSLILHFASLQCPRPIYRFCWLSSPDLRTGIRHQTPLLSTPPLPQELYKRPNPFKRPERSAAKTLAHTGKIAPTAVSVVGHLCKVRKVRVGDEPQERGYVEGKERKGCFLYTSCSVAPVCTLRGQTALQRKSLIPLLCTLHHASPTLLHPLCALHRSKQ